MKKNTLEALRGKPYKEVDGAIKTFLFPSTQTDLSMPNANVLIQHGYTVHFEMRTDMGGVDHKFICVFLHGFRYQYEYDRAVALT